MSRIKKFEQISTEYTPCTIEWIESYFKDKIDWDFIDYLREKLIFVEDKGLECTIGVRVKIFNTYHSLYTDNGHHKEYYCEKFGISAYESSFQKSGLFYMISIDDGTSLAIHILDYMKQISHNIRKKTKPIEFGNDYLIMVQPL